MLLNWCFETSLALSLSSGHCSSFAPCPSFCRCGSVSYLQFSSRPAPAMNLALPIRVPGSDTALRSTGYPFPLVAWIREAKALFPPSHLTIDRSRSPASFFSSLLFPRSEKLKYGRDISLFTVSPLFALKLHTLPRFSTDVPSYPESRTSPMYSLCLSAVLSSRFLSLGGVLFPSFLSLLVRYMIVLLGKNR